MTKKTISFILFLSIAVLLITSYRSGRAQSDSYLYIPNIQKEDNSEPVTGGAAKN